MSLPTAIPEVLWAQRSHQDDATKNIVYLTITAPDCSPDTVEIDIKPTGVHFKGSTRAKVFAVDLELYEEIDVENSKKHFSARGVDLVLRKKELNPNFWPRLLKESKRAHFLRTDFDKWVDEDEQEGESAPAEMPGGGAQFGGGDDAGGFGGIDFSKLGGMEGMDMSALQGLGGMGGGMDMSAFGGGPGGAGAADDDDDDDDMPELEASSGDDKTAEGIEAATPVTGATASGIEEILEDKK